MIPKLFKINAHNDFSVHYHILIKANWVINCYELQLNNIDQPEFFSTNSGTLMHNKT